MSGKAMYITTMLIFGSIGLFVKNINLSSIEIAFLRGVIGSLFLACLSLILRYRIEINRIKENGLWLILSGAAIGINWILLFAAYEYTTIPNATLSYYFAPIFVMALAPFLLKEKLNPVKVASILMAMLGLILIIYSGGSDPGSGYNHPLGILLGLGAAAFYASVIIMNKFIKNLSGYETTLIQLIIAALVLLPYIASKGLALAQLDRTSLFFVLIVGIVHTGFAYFLYFTAIKGLPGQTIALLSYIDPISAVVFAAMLLGEGMSFLQVWGGILILGSTFFSEKLEKKRESSPINLEK